MPVGPISEAGELAAAEGIAPPEDRPRIGTGVEEGIAAIAMALVCVITFANVLVRYFTNVYFAFTEEFSVFLLVVMTLAGAGREPAGVDDARAVLSAVVPAQWRPERAESLPKPVSVDHHTR